MNDITIEQLQAYLKQKYQDSGTPAGFFMKLVEEMGEAAESINQMEGRKAESNHASLAHELADIIHYTLAIAGKYNINLTQAIFEKDKSASVKYHQSPDLEDFIRQSK